MPYVGSRSPFTVTSSDGRGPDDDAEQEEGPPHSSRLNRPSSPSRMNPPPVPFPTAFPATLISATSAKSTSRPMQHALSSNRIILSNGRSLRSSLMSISSSPLSDDKSSSVSRDSRPGYSRTRSLPTYGHKNVHFKEKEEGLESVRLFRFKGKPISVSKPTLNTETESEVTESESSFPPNHFGPSTSLSEIADCSPIPACPSPYANVHLESVTLLPCRPQVLQGTVLVRNIVYEKDVSARFTLDDWTTVSEVLAAYTGPVAAMETLAGSNQGKTVEDLVGPSKASGWDRFNFAIKLEDHESSIWRHTLFLTIRYSAPGVGEFWDNNSGKNYRINFRACGSPAQPEPRRIPSLTLLPISVSPASPLPSRISAHEEPSDILSSHSKPRPSNVLLLLQFWQQIPQVFASTFGIMQPPPLPLLALLKRLLKHPPPLSIRLTRKMESTRASRQPPRRSALRVARPTTFISPRRTLHPRP